MPSPSLLLADARAALAAAAPRRLPWSGALSQAAVAAVLREGGEEQELELLFIRRAEHPEDPWSGHMAFPGGRVDSEDPDALAAAVRETREELGLDLECQARLLGRLSDLPAMARGRPMAMYIVPFVFELISDSPFELNHEVEEALWVPMGFFADLGNRSSMPWRWGAVPVTLPCYRYRERLIWGLTLRMVDDLLARIAPRGPG